MSSNRQLLFESSLDWAEEPVTPSAPETKAAPTTNAWGSGSKKPAPAADFKQLQAEAEKSKPAPQPQQQRPPQQQKDVYRPPARESNYHEERERPSYQQRNYHDNEQGGDYQRREREEVPIPDSAPFNARISNLPYDITEETLNNFFGELGVVSISIPVDHEKQRPKGFAFIEFTTRDGLVNALSCNESDVVFGDRKISVQVARRSANDRQWGQGRGERREETKTWGRDERYGDKNWGPGAGSDRYERKDDRYAPKEERTWGSGGASNRPTGPPSLNLKARSEPGVRRDPSPPKKKPGSEDPFGAAVPSSDEKTKQIMAERAKREQERELKNKQFVEESKAKAEKEKQAREEEKKNKEEAYQQSKKLKENKTWDKPNQGGNASTAWGNNSKKENFGKPKNQQEVPVETRGWEKGDESSPVAEKTNTDVQHYKPQREQDWNTKESPKKGQGRGRGDGDSHRGRGGKPRGGRGQQHQNHHHHTKQEVKFDAEDPSFVVPKEGHVAKPLNYKAALGTATTNVEQKKAMQNPFSALQANEKAED